MDRERGSHRLIVHARGQARYVHVCTSWVARVDNNKNTRLALAPGLSDVLPQVLNIDGPIVGFI